MKFDKNLTAVSTSLLILHLLQKEDMYGYQIISELEQKSNNIFEFKEGTLYPVLHMLEQKKLVESYSVQAAQGRTRKYYRITNQGKKQLAEKAHEWKVFSVAINEILGIRMVGGYY